MEAAGEVGLSGDDDVVSMLDETFDDTGAVETSTLLLLLLLAAASVVAARVALVDPSAGLFAQGNVTYTVCVTVSGRRLMVCVGAVP